MHEVRRAGCPIEWIKEGNRAYRRRVRQPCNSPENEHRDDYDIFRLEQGGRIDRCLLAFQDKRENEHEGRPKKERPNDGERIPRYQQGRVHDFENGEEDDAKTNRRADPACDALVSQNDERREIPREKKENSASTEDLNKTPNGYRERYAQRQKNQIGDTGASETLKIHIWAFYTFPIIYALSSMRCYTFTACRGSVRAN